MTHKTYSFACSPFEFTLALLLAVGAAPVSAQASILSSETFTIIGTGGGGGSGSATSGMFLSDGTVWAGGGAVGLQGPSSFNPFVPGFHPTAGNVAFKFNVGSAVDALDATYGAGNWTIDNAKLTFQYTIYANNTRFGGGPGNFDIYWVGKDDWTAASGGTLNPPYVTTEAALSAWSGNQALIGSPYYGWNTPTYTGSTTNYGNWATDKTGDRQATVSYDLAPAPDFVEDILSASASGDANVSLYLMAASDTLGITIFTGGASVLPTLSFDVVPAAVPVPAAVWLFGSALAGLGVIGRRKAV
jgi:hypothetical protein